MTDLSQRLPATALLVCIAFAASQAAAQNEASPEPTSTVDTAEAATEGKTEPNAASSTTADSPADPSEARADAERPPHDAKNAVYLLELSAKRRILIGAGERGVNYLCEVDVSAEPEAGREAETGTGTGAKSDPGTTLNEAPQETSSGQSFGEVLEGYPKTRKPS